MLALWRAHAHTWAVPEVVVLARVAPEVAAAERHLALPTPPPLRPTWADVGRTRFTWTPGPYMQKYNYMGLPGPLP